MALFRWRKRSASMDRSATKADTAHLEEFARSRAGVEAYVEPQTAVTASTVVFVAADGEWTRRRIDGPDGARRLGQRLGLPVYDVAAVGYPRRMREWSRRQSNGA